MNVVGQAALSPQEIDQHVAHIVTTVGRLGAPGAELGRFVEVAERFRRLRNQYQVQPRSLDTHLPKLAQLRQQFDTLMETRLAEVVDRYHQVVEQIRRAETEKELLRDVLVRRASHDRVNLTGTHAEVTIRTVPARPLPPAGTDGRKQLEDLIRQSGLWPEVSYLSRARLQQALENDRFQPAQQQAISQLFPLTTIHQVSSHPREPHGGGRV